MQLKKNINLGRIKFVLVIVLFFQFLNINVFSEISENTEKFAEILVLDKVSSKSTKLKLSIGEELIFQNLNINILKCQNSRFDDDPEVTAYMQVTDLKSKDNDKVYIFNGWTFSSNPSLRPIDHAIYDIWLKNCENI